eukprot:4411123-Prymnesium_polylepis.1
MTCLRGSKLGDANWLRTLLPSSKTTAKPASLSQAIQVRSALPGGASTRRASVRRCDKVEDGNAAVIYLSTETVAGTIRR